MRVLRTEAHRRIASLIAEKSIKRSFVGPASRIMGAISVGRALDKTTPGKGKIYMPDPVNDPMLVRGIDTQFDHEAQIGGLLVLPSVNGDAANAEILEIRGPEEVKLKREFKGPDAVKQLTGRDDTNEDRQLLDSVGNGQKGVSNAFKGTPYKIAPKVDQTKVYDAVFDRLNAGDCVCIFPEGGSHDRTELLPLKGRV